MQSALLQSSSTSKPENSKKKKNIFQVHFKTESCYLRSSDANYTFKDLASDSAVYFSLIPEDCLLADENDLIWPSHGKVLEEYNEKENKLVLKLKYGRVVRNPIAANLNLEDIVSEIKLETRLERMKNWVIERENTVQKKRNKEEGIFKSICDFSFYLTFIILLFITVFAP